MLLFLLWFPLLSVKDLVAMRWQLDVYLAGNLGKDAIVMFVVERSDQFSGPARRPVCFNVNAQHLTSGSWSRLLVEVSGHQ